MKKKYVFIFVGIICVLVVYAFRGTIYGLYLLPRLKWQEEHFVGKPVSEFEAYLFSKGGSLNRVDRQSFSSATDHKLAGKERGLYFKKDKNYSWWGLGTVANIGYVVVESGANGERVARIIKRQSIDSL